MEREIQWLTRTKADCFKEGAFFALVLSNSPAVARTDESWETATAQSTSPEITHSSKCICHANQWYATINKPRKGSNYWRIRWTMAWILHKTIAPTTFDLRLHLKYLSLKLDDWDRILFSSGGGKESSMARSVSLWYVMLSTNSLSILQYFFATHELPTSAPILGICASDFTTQATYGKVKELEWQEVIRNTIVVTLWVYHCNNSLSSVKVDAAYVTMYCIAIWIDESLGFFCLRKVTP